MDQLTGQDASLQVKVFSALWRLACRKAVFALHNPTHPDQTGGDPLHAWRVMNLARQLVAQQREPSDDVR